MNVIYAVAHTGKSYRHTGNRSDLWTTNCSSTKVLVATERTQGVPANLEQLVRKPFFICLCEQLRISVARFVVYSLFYVALDRFPVCW